MIYLFRYIDDTMTRIIWNNMSTIAGKLYKVALVADNLKRCT